MTTLITNSQFKQFDANGKPLAGGLIHTYIVGTTTDKVTYQDEDNTVAHENPIALDSWGEATIWIDGDTRFYITDAAGAEIRNYPSFDDGGGGANPEYPVNPSPDGAVLRSSATETGYIKIQLPMGEWPDTKLMFDLMVYDDATGETFTMTLGGYANSAAEEWQNTTAITNNNISYAVQFGHDGTYPAIYIGAVDSEWDMPQIAVVNFLAGEFSYTWSDWDNGWVVSVTTSIGTITDTPTLIKKYALASNAETITGTEAGKVITPASLNSRTSTEERTGILELATVAEAVAGTDAERAVTPAGLVAAAVDALNGMWGDWVTLTPVSGVVQGVPIMRYRVAADGRSIHICGVFTTTGNYLGTDERQLSGTSITQPDYDQYFSGTVGASPANALWGFVLTDGGTLRALSDGGMNIGEYKFNAILPLD